MTVLSRLAPSAITFARSAPLLVRFSSGIAFRSRPGQFQQNRVKDIIHFYTIGIVFLPLCTVYMLVNVVFGHCELTDWPEDHAPRYWQFETKPLKQLSTKYLTGSDQSYHERQYGYYYWSSWKVISSQIGRRVRHLQTQRQDYRGYGYVPIKDIWFEKAHKESDRLRNYKSSFQEVTIA